MVVRYCAQSKHQVCSLLSTVFDSSYLYIIIHCCILYFLIYESFFFFRSYDGFIYTYSFAWHNHLYYAFIYNVLIVMYPVIHSLSVFIKSVSISNQNFTIQRCNILKLRLFYGMLPFLNNNSGSLKLGIS
jgi:hypothetical protein